MDPKIRILEGTPLIVLYASKKLEECHLRSCFSSLIVSHGIHFGIKQNPEPICFIFGSEVEKKLSFCIGD